MRRLQVLWIVALTVVAVYLIVVMFRTQSAASVSGDESQVTAAAPSAASGTTLAQVRAVTRSTKPKVIQILGDSTGNADDEWVALWAREYLARDHSVVLHQWDTDAAKWYRTLTFGSGPQMVIWNMSSAGSQADYPQSIIKQAVPQRPDLLIFNYEHNNTSNNIVMQLDHTQAAVTNLYGHEPPVVTMLQNPSTAKGFAEQQVAAVRTMRTYGAKALGMYPVDVWTAFKKAGVAQLLIDGIHPTPAGSQIWADVVGRAIS